jgi:hypothetical protein
MSESTLLGQKISILAGWPLLLANLYKSKIPHPANNTSLSLTEHTQKSYGFLTWGDAIVMYQTNKKIKQIYDGENVQMQQMMQ